MPEVFELVSTDGVIRPPKREFVSLMRVGDTERQR